MRRFADVDWFAEVNACGVVAIATQFGLDHNERTHALGPCPSCNAAKRHPKRGDKRGALGVRRDGRGWVCFQCEQSGDAVTLAALCLTGKAKPDREGWKLVRRACAERGFCSPNPHEGGAAVLTVMPRPRPPPPLPAPPPARPPVDELAVFWTRTCVPVTEDPEVSAWLSEQRGLSPTTIDERNLARALPRTARPPRWARFEGASWVETSHRLIVPMYGATGQMESVHARALAPKHENGRDKAASVAGAEVRGLVMADALGVLLLAEDSLGDGTPATELVRRVGIIIAEGEPDFLTWATFYGEAAESAPMVLGVVSGSWTDELAAAVPDSTLVIVRTHRDDAGAKYADRICSTLAERCDVRRLRKET